MRVFGPQLFGHFWHGRGWLGLMASAIGIYRSDFSSGLLSSNSNSFSHPFGRRDVLGWQCQTLNMSPFLLHKPCVLWNFRVSFFHQVEKKLMKHPLRYFTPFKLAMPETLELGLNLPGLISTSPSASHALKGPNSGKFFYAGGA